QWPSLQDASVRPAGLALYQDPGSMRWRGLQVVRSPMLPPPPLEADVTLLHPVRPQLIVPVNPAIAHALAPSVLEIARTTWHFDQDGLRRLIWPAQALALTNYDRVLKHIQRALPGQRTDAGRLPWVMPTVLRREIRVDELTMGLLAGSGQVCSTA